METRPEDIFLRIEKALSHTNAQKEAESEKLLSMQVSPGQLIESLRILSEKLGIKQLSTITGLDAGDKIELNYHFWRVNRIIAVKTAVPKNDPRIETCTSVIPGAVLYEMEVHDMFGVTFRGHPWMDRKLLLPDNYPSDMPPPLLKGTSSKKIRKAVGVEK